MDFKLKMEKMGITSRRNKPLFFKMVESVWKQVYNNYAFDDFCNGI